MEAMLALEKAGIRKLIQAQAAAVRRRAAYPRNGSIFDFRAALPIAPIICC